MTMRPGWWTASLGLLLLGSACSSSPDPKYWVGGTVSGLQGSGLVLHSSIGDDLAVTANGSFAFPTVVVAGTGYTVTVKTQPTNLAQTCVVANGNGLMGDANVTNVAVTCTTNTHALGGTVSGLQGTGLVLQDGVRAEVAILADGAFSFMNPVVGGSDYAVTVKSQPVNPWQTCSVDNGIGKVGDADVTTIAVTCSTSNFKVGGTLSGMLGTGLVLQNGLEELVPASDGTFAFVGSSASGTAYAVTVKQQPTSPWQTCAVGNGAGTVAGADVADIAVTCVTNTYAVVGTVSGVAGTGMVLQATRLGGASEDLPGANGAFAFPTRLPSGSTYLVTVKTQPAGPSQTCSVAEGAGVVGGADVVVSVACSTNSYSLKGTVAGLAGTGLVLQTNTGEELPVTAASFTFPTKVPSGTAYAVTVKAQPTGPSQTCAVAGGSGTVGGADVTSIAVTCVTNTYAVGGTVSGLAGTGLVLQNSGGDDKPVAVNGAFSFATLVASGSTYAVTVKTQPSSPSQTCTVANGNGTVAGASISGVAVTCTTNSYSVGGTVSGLAGTGLVLLNGGGDDKPVAVNGAFTFATSVASGLAYAVTVKTQPSSPSQACAVTAGSGVVGGANVTNVVVTCKTNYQVAANVTGLAGAGLLLQDNGGDDLAVAAPGGLKPFATLVTDGSAYAVTVKTQPTVPWQTCSVGAGATGTVSGANVTVPVSCTTNLYTVGGSVSGLTGTGLVLQNNGGNDLTVTASARTFTFTNSVASGEAYQVLIKTQPVGQTCGVTAGTGTVAGANVVSVAVACSSVVVQRWEAPTWWGAAWVDNGKMLHHAWFDGTTIAEDLGLVWSVAGGTLPAQRELKGFPSGSRWGAGPFSGALRYQATGGSDAAIDLLTGDILVCAVIKPDFDPTPVTGNGKEKTIIAKGIGIGSQSVPGGAWALMQMHDQFCFHYQGRDSVGNTFFNMAYTPTYFANQDVPGTGPLNPSYVVVCGGRSGNTIRAAANNFNDTGNLYPATLTGVGTIQLDQASPPHRLTIGGVDNGDPNLVFGGRVFETAVWNEPATPANIQAKFAAFQGLTMGAGNPTLVSYSRNREGPSGADAATYHTTWRHGPRIDPAKGILFGLQAWNRVSYCTPVACDQVGTTPRFPVAAGEEFERWTRSGAGSVVKNGLVEPPGDSDQKSARLITLSPGSTLSSQLGRFDSAGTIHGQLWIRPVSTAGRIRVRTTDSTAPTSVSPSIDFATLATGQWTRVWLTGLVSGGPAATGGSVTLEALSANSGSVQFYAWGLDLTQIAGGGNLGTFDPGPAMYDWSASLGRFGDDIKDDPLYVVDVLELPRVPVNPASGFCLSADAQPPAEMDWTAPFVNNRPLIAWVHDTQPVAMQVFAQGTAAGGTSRKLCAYVTDGGGSACFTPAWLPGSKHNVKGCLSAAGELRIYADDVQAGNVITGIPVPTLTAGHVVVGNATVADPVAYPAAWGVGAPGAWHGYVSKVLVCRDPGSGGDTRTCN
jgi:hypothetical protein